MDEIDLRIIRELQIDGRLTNQDLADRVGLSPSPCLRRVRQLERDGVITGYTANVDAPAVGLTITAFVRIRLESHSAEVVDEVEQRFREIDNIVEVYLMAGDTDYLLRIVVDSFPGYEDLLRTKIRTIPSLASIDTSFAFGTPKLRSPLPLPRKAKRKT